MRARFLGVFLAAGAFLAVFAQAPAPDPAKSPATPDPAKVSDAKPKAVGTMSQLMVEVIYPTSDALFYVVRGAPENDKGWAELQMQMLVMAESANLLMMDGRTRDKGKWMDDAKLLLDVGQKAYKAAKAKDGPAMVALSDELYNACVTCHEDYRRGYGTRPRPGKP